MNLIHRRGFMKTVLASAAGASSLLVEPWRTRATAIPEKKSIPPAAVLEHGEQQLRIVAAGGRLGFQNFVRVSNEWHPATLPGVHLVTGPSFALRPASVSSTNAAVLCKGSGRATGLDGSPVAYGWNAEITAHRETSFPWFRFQTQLDLPHPIRLQQANHVEPQIVIWLNSVSTLMEGQSGSWRRVLLQQPTRNSLGAWGNDLPALYLLDQNVGIETLMYFDVGDMDWMSIENTPRFLVYRCTSVTQIDGNGTQRLGVGLIADQATGDVLPAGSIRFSYWLLQRPVTALLTEQQAVTRWMEALLPLFEERLIWPRCASNWKDFAAGATADLQRKAETQVEVGGRTGLRAYVKETSRLWKQPANNFELMTVADVVWPSLLYLTLHPSPEFGRQCDQLISDLPGFYHSDTHSISNDFVRPPNERADSWYPFENGLIKYPMIGSLAGSKDVVTNFLSAFETAEKMAREYDYLFPIYYEVATRRAQGAGTNYAIGGLYAWSALIANRLTGAEHYRDEARQAVRALCTVPAERLFHEPQELAYGALAAADLGMQDEAKYLLYQQLRMFYWYSDPSQKTHDIRGMVQAAASILYPAFKENTEAILPWTAIMRRGLVIEGLLRFMDQQRRNNFSFFENCSGDRRDIAMAFIPFENLGTLELGGQTGNVGKEIYGAGECIWMYLMFEALGQVSDRELMLVNLDLLDSFDRQQFPPRQLNFMLYNPTDETRSATISIPPARGGSFRMSGNGSVLSGTLNLPARGQLPLLVEF